MGNKFLHNSEVFVWLMSQKEFDTLMQELQNLCVVSCDLVSVGVTDGPVLRSVRCSLTDLFSAFSYMVEQVTLA